MTMLDYVDVVVAAADDDDDDERTRTGPYAVRPDIEHQVHHNAKISVFFFFFFTTFSAHTKKAGQQARAKRGVWPYLYYLIP